MARPSARTDRAGQEVVRVVRGRLAALRRDGEDLPGEGIHHRADHELEDAERPEAREVDEECHCSGHTLSGLESVISGLKRPHARAALRSVLLPLILPDERSLAIGLLRDVTQEESENLYDQIEWIPDGFSDRRANSTSLCICSGTNRA